MIELSGNLEREIAEKNKNYAEIAFNNDGTTVKSQHHQIRFLIIRNHLVRTV
jgi:hypothetical protein